MTGTGSKIWLYTGKAMFSLLQIEQPQTNRNNSVYIQKCNPFASIVQKDRRQNHTGGHD